jgi:hypothetical protein
MRLRLCFVLGALLISVSAIIDCSTDTKSTSYTVRGVAQKGPAQVGATVTIQELTSGLGPAGKTYLTTTTDDAGSFRLDTPVGSELIEINVQGRFFDEVRGCTPNGQFGASCATVNLTLHAIARAEASQSTANVNVNVLTHIQSLRLRKLVQAGKPFANAEEQSRAEVLTALGIPQVSKAFNTLTLAEDGESNGELLAISVLLARAALPANTGDAPTGELIDSLRQDLEDGVLDTPRLKEALERTRRVIGYELCYAPPTPENDRVKKTLEAYYAERGIPATVPDWRQFFTAATPTLPDGGGCPLF